MNEGMFGRLQEYEGIEIVRRVADLTMHCELSPQAQLIAPSCPS